MTEKTTAQKWLAVDLFTGEIVTEETIPGAKRKRADRKSPEYMRRHHELFALLAQMCGMVPPERNENGSPDWTRLTRSELGMLNRAAKYVHEKEAADDDIRGFQRWFRKDRARLPMPMDYATNWTRYRAGVTVREFRARHNPLMEALNGDNGSRIQGGDGILGRDIQKSDGKLE